MTKKAIVLLRLRLLEYFTRDAGFIPRSFIFVLVGFFSFAALACVSLKSFEVKNKLEKRKVAWQQLNEDIEATINRFGVDASIVLKDFSTGWTTSINSQEFVPSASVVKIPIMASYFLANSEGKVDLNKELTLEGRFKVPGPGTLNDFPNGTAVNINKLIELMISQSDNTATNMLIEYIGFDYLNDAFKRLGLKDTNIVRKMIDFESRKEGRENYTSAQDIASMLDKIYAGKLINRDYSEKALCFLARQKICDRLPKRLPAGTIVAHKTGLERNVCHDAGIVFSPYGDYLICVLTRHHSKTARLAKAFIAKVSLEVYNFYRDNQ